MRAQPARRVTNIENGPYAPICQGTNSAEAFQSARSHGSVRPMQPGKIRVAWREKRSSDSVTATIASSKAWIFSPGLIGNVEITNKLESLESCGLAEEIPKQLFLSFSRIFPHTLAAGEGLSASNHPPQKKNQTHLLPRNDRDAWLADEAPGAMISALMRTSEGLSSSIAECVTHPSSF